MRKIRTPIKWFLDGFKPHYFSGIGEPNYDEQEGWLGFIYGEKEKWWYYWN